MYCSHLFFANTIKGDLSKNQGSRNFLSITYSSSRELFRLKPSPTLLKKIGVLHNILQLYVQPSAMLMDGNTGLSGRIVPLLVAKELEGATAHVPDHYTREKDVPCL